MSYPDIEQIGKIEQELEIAEQEFRKASQVKSFSGMMRMHNRVCQLVAALSAAYSGSAPTVFARYLLPPETPVEAQAQAPAPAAPLAAAQTTQDLSAGTAVTNNLPDMGILEKQLEALAFKMQTCLESGDMDGMLKASEGMGNLSELMTHAEGKKKEKPEETESSGDKEKVKDSDPLALITKISAEHAHPGSSATTDSTGTNTGGWAPGETMALAKQKAMERKSKHKSRNSLELVVDEVARENARKSAAEAESEQAQTLESCLNERTTKRLRKTAQELKRPPKQSAPAKLPMTPEQLRDRLESCNFYEILSVPSTVSYDELHLSFFKNMRMLNKKLLNKTMEMWQFQEFIALVCLSHDILKCPSARLQYDLSVIGVHDSIEPESTTRTNWMPMKDMLRFSTLVSLRELSQAIEIHKESTNERDVGYYLVEKGLLSSEELDSIFFAQKLISAGKLTVGQFELAMQDLRDNAIPLLDTLVASEWIRPQDIFSADFL